MAPYRLRYLNELNQSFRKTKHDETDPAAAESVRHHCPLWKPWPCRQRALPEQGAVSQSLQELERQLSTPLFDRIHPRLQLNNEGRLLQPAAEELLTRMQDIENLFSPDAEPSGQLRLGASQTIGNYLLPTLLASSKQELGLPPR